MKTKSLDWNAVPESFEREVRVPVFVDNLMDLTRATVLNVDNAERMRGSLAATTFYVASRLGPGSLFAVLDVVTGTVLLSSDGKNITALNQNLLRSFFEAAEIYFHARNDLIVKIESTVKSSLRSSNGNNPVVPEANIESRSEKTDTLSEPKAVFAEEPMTELPAQPAGSEEFDLNEKSESQAQVETDPAQVDLVDLVDMVDTAAETKKPISEDVSSAPSENTVSLQATKTAATPSNAQDAVESSPAPAQPAQPIQPTAPVLKRRISISAPAEPTVSPAPSTDSLATENSGTPKHSETSQKPEKTLPSEPVKGEGYVELNPSMFKRRTVSL